MPQSLNTLLAAHRADTNDPAAESAFFSAVRQRAMRLAGGDEDLAEDIMLAVIHGLPTITGDFSRWLASTARRIKADYLRSLIRERRRIAGFDEAKHGIPAETDFPDVDLESLTPAEYQIATYLLSGYTVKEIAAMENLGESAIRTRFWRIRERNM